MEAASTGVVLPAVLPVLPKCASKALPVTPLRSLQTTLPPPVVTDRGSAYSPVSQASR
jgi:hypothetical protein